MFNMGLISMYNTRTDRAGNTKANKTTQREILF
jgi:hypothetical protein